MTNLCSCYKAFSFEAKTFSIPLYKEEGDLVYGEVGLGFYLLFCPFSTTAIAGGRFGWRDLGRWWWPAR